MEKAMSTGTRLRRLSWLTVVLVGSSLLLASCGSTSKKESNESSQRRVARGGDEPQYVVTTSATVRDRRGFQGDDDDDDVGESRTYEKQTRFDGDDDPDNDRADNENKPLYDGDDGRIRDYGREARGATRRTLASLAMRYYAAARADRGDVACALHKTPNAVVEDYASVASPSYQQGARTCDEVLSRAFERFHRQLAENRVVVANVRVGHDFAYVVLASRTQPVSYLPVALEDGKWGVVGLLSGPLP